MRLPIIGLSIRDRVKLINVPRSHSRPPYLGKEDTFFLFFQQRKALRSRWNVIFDSAVFSISTLTRLFCSQRSSLDYYKDANNGSLLRESRRRDKGNFIAIFAITPVNRRSLVIACEHLADFSVQTELSHLSWSIVVATRIVVTADIETFACAR